MAINRALTFYDRSKAVPAASGVEINDEGLVMVQVLESGVEHVQPSLGTSANEVILGFSSNTSYRPTTRVEQESATVPAASTYTVQLSKVLLVSGSLRVVNTATNAALTVVTTTPSTGEVQVNYTTGLLTFNSAQASINVYVTYRRSLTADEIAFTVRQPAINAGTGNALGLINVIRGNGEISTDMFDTTADYSTATTLYAGANGLVTSVSSSHSPIPGSRMVTAPSASVTGDLRFGAMITLAFNLA